MKLKTIEYSESHESFNPLGLKKWRKAGISAELEDSEDAQEKLGVIKGLVEDFIRKGDAPMQTEVATDNTPLPSIDRREQDRLEALIDDCTSVDELANLRELIHNYGLEKSYDNKLKQLSLDY